jgi:hypothetical protein
MSNFRKITAVLSFMALIVSNVCFAKSTQKNELLGKEIDKRCHMYMRDIESRNELPKGELMMVGGNDVIVSCVVDYVLPGPTGIDTHSTFHIIGNFKNQTYEVQEQ